MKQDLDGGRRAMHGLAASSSLRVVGGGANLRCTVYTATLQLLHIVISVPFTLRFSRHFVSSFLMSARVVTSYPCELQIHPPTLFTLAAGSLKVLKPKARAQYVHPTSFPAPESSRHSCPVSHIRRLARFCSKVPVCVPSHPLSAHTT